MKITATRVGSVLCAAMLAGSVYAGDLDDDLAVALDDATPGESVSALLFLMDQVDLVGTTAELDARRATLAERHEVVVRALQAAAQRSQPRLVEHLEALKAAGRIDDYSTLWISNTVRVDGPPAEIKALAARLDIERAFLNYPIEVVAPVGEVVETTGTDGDVEIGVEAVRAPEAWALGFDGTGVLVANIDTGVAGGHEALSSRWRGVADPRYAGHPEWAWFDPFAGQNDFPYDNNGHGTHTMGTVCGGLPGEQIGVAPGSQWIAAGAIDRGGGIPTTVEDALESMQWMLDPDGDPSTNWDVPAVCSNSWGLVTSHGYAPCDPTFWSPIDASEAAGTLVVFAAGNEGSSGLRRPGDRATDEYSTLAVAAIDPFNPTWPAASFSSRGPTFCTPDGTAAIKPDIAAPGVNTRSSLPSGGYGSLSGTSMATPHINGVVALMRQANPNLTIPQIKQIMYDTAFDLGGPGEDNTYGYGMVDAYECVLIALSLATATFEFPEGLPEFVLPAGGTAVSVRVVEQAATPDPTTGLMHYVSEDGSGSVPMVHLGGEMYEAIFPAFECTTVIDYYFTIETTEGELVVSPIGAPDNTYATAAFSGVAVVAEDDFESDNGWTVENIDIARGQWERAVPVGGGDRRDPETDYDGSGQCWVTEAADGDTDVDGGPTILTSPAWDLSTLPEPVIECAIWFSCDDAGVIPSQEDFLTIELSNDGGASWTHVVDYESTDSWKVVQILVSDYVTPSAQTHIRFIAVDNPSNSLTEAGIDALRVFSNLCGGVEGDVTGDGVVSIEDLLAVLAAWGDCSGCPEDIDGDGVVSVTDLLIVLANWS